MADTLVIQSHRTPLPYPWIGSCLVTVRDWCELNSYKYKLIGDELFEAVPAHLFEKTQQQKVIATDLARLIVLHNFLENYQTVIWLDADFLIFKPEKFVMPDQPYAVGREVWVQQDKNGKLKVYKKVHNAFLMFRRGNHFLDFYIDTATRLLSDNTGAMPPQFIGPKLLTALHNVVNLPVLETAGMLSPLVIKDMILGAGPALNLFNTNSSTPVAGANLCISSCANDDISATEMQQLIQILLKKS